MIVDNLTIVFKNGEKLLFRTSEFSIDVSGDSIADASLPQKFTY